MEGPATSGSDVVAVIVVLIAVWSAISAQRSRKARDEAEARAAEALEAVADARRADPLTLEVVKADRSGPTYALRNNTEESLIVEGVDRPGDCQVLFHHDLPLTIHRGAAEELFLACPGAGSTPSALLVQVRGEQRSRTILLPRIR